MRDYLDWYLGSNNGDGCLFLFLLVLTGVLCVVGIILLQGVH